eukprot:Nitzschia sp. Nitz4//scaffold161_size51353//44835//45568//NITZ4_006958-RA/size51353-augustus-gene-0.53-mRNA-1//-1//CDS//3329537939//1617//frame0
MSANTLFRSILLLVCLFQSTLASTQFSISDSGVSCSGNLQVTSLELDCGNYCTFGSDVSISGSLTIDSDLSTNTPEISVKVANMVEIFDKEVNICKSLWVNSGSDCPSAGNYTLKGFNFKIPGDGDEWYAQNGYWGVSVGVKATFDFGDSKSVCTTSVKLSKRNGYQMVAGGVAMFALAGVLVGVQRRRRVATIQLGHDEGTQSHFEMMSSDAGVSV